MLSRAAENLYWMGRQLERAENTARLVDATTEVLLDSPSGIEISWKQLLQVVGHHDHESINNEADAVRWLLRDESNTSSVVMCVRQARENARGLRELLPREYWEQLNHLHLRTPALMTSAQDRPQRHRALTEIVRGRLLLRGILSETMSHDAAYEFIRLGVMLERADMTSRILDISSAVASTSPGDLGMESTWISILKSLSAFQMYRRHRDVRISPQMVVRFLFLDDRFPRSISHCIDTVENTLSELPSFREPLRATRHCARVLSKVVTCLETDGGLALLIDEVQQRLADVHMEITETYFHPQPESTSAA